MERIAQTRLKELSINDVYSTLNMLGRWDETGVREVFDVLNVESRVQDEAERIKNIILNTFTARKFAGMHEGTEYEAQVYMMTLNNYMGSIIRYMMHKVENGDTTKSILDVINYTGFTAIVSVKYGDTTFDLDVLDDDITRCELLDALRDIANKVETNSDNKYRAANIDMGISIIKNTGDLVEILKDIIRYFEISA